MNKKSAHAALLKAYNERESQLKGYLRRFVDGDVNDICQETMVRCLEAAKDRDVRHPGAFLFGVARNIVRKRFERKTRSLIDFIADFSPDDYVVDVRPLDDIMDEQERLTRFSEDFQSSCTPGYYNNEGQPNPKSVQNASYGKGPNAFFTKMKAWREEGSMQGLELG